MTPSHPVDEYLAQAWPADAWHDVTVVVAVSGGADSVALLRAMHRAKRSGPGRLIAAHFNHRLRGAESQADEDFVIDLAARLELPCRVGRAARSPAETHAGQGPEAVARQFRYDFFRRTADACGARYLVTAHTADDQAETILQRILRGTGVGGLAGMQRVRTLSPATTILRPLLGLRRSALLDYLQYLDQPFRRDSSNADRRFTRNRIRHELLPHLAREYNAQVVEALLRLGTLAGEVQAVIEPLVAELIEQCVAYSASGSVRIDGTRLARQPRYLVRELLMAVWRRQDWPQQAMRFAHWEQLADLALGDDGQHTFPGRVQALAVGGELRLQASHTQGPEP